MIDLDSVAESMACENRSSKIHHRPVRYAWTLKYKAWTKTQWGRVPTQMKHHSNSANLTVIFA